MITLKRKLTGVVNRKTTPVSNIVKKITKWRTSLKSRHPSHNPLRRQLPLLPFRSVVRLGSTSITSPGKVECNSIEGVKNSSNKLLMKQCFTRANVKTADWWEFRNNHFYFNNTNETTVLSELPYPIIAKSLFGSRGEGNTKIDSQEQLDQWMRGRTLYNYIFERFYNYKLEYRFHTNKNGCFYICRKALKENTPENKKWCMNSETCTWYLDTNDKFFKPNSFDDIKAECVKALHSLGLDFCAFDVKVQGETLLNGKKRDYQDFFIIEGNSAPSLNEIGLNHYIQQIPIILKDKYINGA